MTRGLGSSLQIATSGTLQGPQDDLEPARDDQVQPQPEAAAPSQQQRQQEGVSVAQAPLAGDAGAQAEQVQGDHGLKDPQSACGKQQALLAAAPPQPWASPDFGDMPQQTWMSPPGIQQLLQSLDPSSSHAGLLGGDPVLMLAGLGSPVIGSAGSAAAGATDGTPGSDARGLGGCCSPVVEGYLAGLRGLVLGSPGLQLQAVMMTPSATPGGERRGWLSPAAAAEGAGGSKGCSGGAGAAGGSASGGARSGLEDAALGPQADTGKAAARAVAAAGGDGGGSVRGGSAGTPAGGSGSKVRGC